MILLEARPGPKLWLAADPPQSDDAHDQPGTAPDTQASGLRVLIVEDEFYIALDLEASLASLGHATVGTAVSADMAVRIAERERPDVVLMDIRLAGPRDGIDAAEEIYTRFGIRSLFVTANTDPQTRQRATGVNPVGILEKPLSLQRLRAILEQIADRA
jgi:two-component system, response regulator PdtaR